MLLVKVDKTKLVVEIEDELDETTWEELVEGLPEAGPRFVAFRCDKSPHVGQKTVPLNAVFAV